MIFVNAVGRTAGGKTVSFGGAWPGQLDLAWEGSTTGPGTDGLWGTPDAIKIVFPAHGEHETMVWVGSDQAKWWGPVWSHADADELGVLPTGLEVVRSHADAGEDLDYRYERDYADQVTWVDTHRLDLVVFGAFPAIEALLRAAEAWGLLTPADERAASRRAYRLERIRQRVTRTPNVVYDGLFEALPEPSDECAEALRPVFGEMRVEDMPSGTYRQIVFADLGADIIMEVTEPRQGAGRYFGVSGIAAIEQRVRQLLGQGRLDLLEWLE